MIELTVTCAQCGTDHTPSHDAYVRGDWRTCTRCRDGPGEQAPGVILDDSSALEAILEPPYCQAEPGKDTPHDRFRD